MAERLASALSADSLAEPMRVLVLRWSRSFFSRWGPRAGATGLCLYVMDGLAHLGLSPLTFAAVWATLALVLGLHSWFEPTLGTRLREGAIAVAALFLCRAAFHLGVSGGQIVYLAVLMELATALLAAAMPRGALQAGPGPVENWRLLAAAAIGLAAVFPFVTDHLAGGSDARWYGMVMVDYIKQERAGVFPILNGQSEFAFSGGIHPYRTAPLHLWLGALTDVLTFRSLTPLAIQHLTVVLSALAASVGMYLALTTLAPRARWMAWLVTAILATAPAQLAAIYTSEAYMTFMTFPGLVAVMFGNILTFGSRQKAGWWWLTVGLAYSWMGHTSVAAVALLATGVGQLGWALAQGLSRQQVRGALGAAVLFAGLCLGYVVALREVIAPVEGNTFQLIMGVAGMTSLVVGLALTESKGLFAGLGWLITGTLAFIFIRHAMLVYGGAVLFLAAALDLAKRLSPKFFLVQNAWLRVLAILGLATGIAGKIVGENFPGEYPTVPGSLETARDAAFYFVHWVPADGMSAGTFQPGWGLVYLSGVALIAAVVCQALRQRILAVMLLFLFFLILPLPYFADFFWGNLPPEVITLTSIAFNRRILPALCTVMAYAGFAGYCVLPRRWPRALAMAGAVALLPLSLWDASKFTRAGWHNRSPWAATKLFYHADNDVLSRYPFDFLKIPSYFSNGIQDYRLESRLLEPDAVTIRFGPEQYARLLEKKSDRVLTLTAKTQNNTSPWLIFEPPVTVPPHSDWIFRQQYLQAPASGFLLIVGQHGFYREYNLPQSGFGQTFGYGPGQHGVFSGLNPSELPELYTWEMIRTGTFAPEAGAGPLFNLHISNYDGGALPVEVTATIPYRATTRLAQPGWLETFRAWLPGYAATVNGRGVEVRKSRESLVMLPVPAGVSAVELKYVGTRQLHLAVWVSSLAAVFAALIGFSRWRVPPVNTPSFS